MDYKIHYSQRRKTLRITVERDRSVTVQAPEHYPVEKIENWLEKKIEWIKSKQEHPQKYPTPVPVKDFVSGSSFMFMGNKYLLEITSLPNKQHFYFDNKFYVNVDYKQKAESLLEKWYRQQARASLIPKIEFYAKNLGVNYKRVAISKLKYRWGSCSPSGNLNFNWRIIKAPIFVVNYILVHELAHLIELNHSAEFWNIVSVQVPDYQKAIAWLKDNGLLLEMDF
ncbi:MAG: zinc metalloprotease [Mucilaginibacter sp.]|nr:zinc metalloprotease [Mucilaginibacter sp.]